MSNYMHVCKSCNGKRGYVWEPFRPWIDCFVCKGDGEVDSETMENIEIGKKLRKARIAAGISLMDAAEKYGVGPAVISGIELRGHHHTEATGFIELLNGVIK